MREQTFTGHGGLELAADRFEGERETPVVLLHGGGQTRHSWGETAVTLAAAGWPTLSVDLRGHGDSDWAGDYELNSFAGDAVAAAEAAGAPPVFVGASMGGISALRALALDPPVEAAGLVLVDVAHRFEISGARRIVSFMDSQGRFDDPSEATEAVAAYLEASRERPQDTSGIHKNLRPDGDGWRWHWDPAMVEGSKQWLGRADELGRGFVETLSSLEIPTLLIWGGLSDVVTPEIAAEFASIAPSAEVTEVPRTGHMIAGDSNEPFTETVLDFLLRRFG